MVHSIPDPLLPLGTTWALWFVHKMSPVSKTHSKTITCRPTVTLKATLVVLDSMIRQWEQQVMRPHQYSQISIFAQAAPYSY